METTNPLFTSPPAYDDRCNGSIETLFTGHIYAGTFVLFVKHSEDQKLALDAFDKVAPRFINWILSDPESDTNTRTTFPQQHNRFHETHNAYQITVYLDKYSVVSMGSYEFRVSIIESVLKVWREKLENYLNLPETYATVIK